MRPAPCIVVDMSGHHPWPPPRRASDVLIHTKTTVIDWDNTARIREAEVKGDVAGHAFHGNRYTGGIGGGASAAEMTAAQWKDATAFANATMTEDERKDAFYLYDAEENNEAGRVTGREFKTVQEMQDYAEGLVEKYGTPGTSVLLVNALGDGYAGNTELQNEPNHFLVQIDPGWKTQQVVCHEISHAIATEASGFMGHGASFRETYLRVLDGEMPAYAQAVRATLAQGPAARTKAAPALTTIARVSGDGKSIECFGPTRRK